jgi:uncharacterized protein YutE (UPF0331/DUF86 family)
VLDRDRILAKIDQLDGYLRELGQVVPPSFADYVGSIEKRRACERLLQVAIECVIDICGLLVAALRLGLPAEEDDLFTKLEQAHIISSGMAGTLRSMKGFRNVLVHEYGGIDDALVYKFATTRMGGFESFRTETLKALKASGS